MKYTWFATAWSWQIATEWQASKLMVQTLRPNQIDDNINADCRHTNKQIQVEVSVAVGGLGFGCAWPANATLQLPRHGKCVRDNYSIPTKPNRQVWTAMRNLINSHTNPSINKYAGKHASPMTNMKYCWAFLACEVNVLHAKSKSLHTRMQFDTDPIYNPN